MIYDNTRKRFSGFTKYNDVNLNDRAVGTKNGGNSNFPIQALIDKFEEVHGGSFRVYEFESELVASDIQLDEYALVEESGYLFYKISNIVATGGDIALTSGYIAKLSGEIGKDTYATADALRLASPNASINTITLESYHAGSQAGFGRWVRTGGIDSGKAGKIGGDGDYSAKYTGIPGDFGLCWDALGAEWRNLSKDIESYGLIADSVSDATLNKNVLQNWVDNRFSLAGGKLILPPGSVYIEYDIQPPFSAGWTIEGDSRLGTKLVCVTDNRPCIQFLYDLTHSWTIKNLTFSWLNQQTSADTLSKGLYFNSSTAPADTDSFFLWNLFDVAFEMGYELFGTNESNNNLTWGWTIDRISIGNTTVGRAWSQLHGGNGGQPSNGIGYALIDAVNMSGPAIDTKTANFVADIIEVLGGTSYPAASLKEGYMHITQLKCEAWTLNPLMAGRGIIECTNTGYQISEFRGDFRNTDIGAGQKVFLSKTLATPNGDQTFGEMNIATTDPIISGEQLLTNEAGERGRFRVKSIQRMDDFKLGDTTTSDANNWATVDEWANSLLSRDNGDTDITLEVGDETTQDFSTALTASRTITLPEIRAGSTNLFNGLTYKIIRSGGGAFTLSIAHEGGTHFTIPASTNMIVEVTFRRNAWITTNKVTL